jgi:hypothetical protein
MQAQLLLCELFRTIREQLGRHKELSCHASILLWTLGSNNGQNLCGCVPFRRARVVSVPLAAVRTTSGCNGLQLVAKIIRLDSLGFRVKVAMVQRL